MIKNVRNWLRKPENALRMSEKYLECQKMIKHVRKIFRMSEND